MDKKAIKAFAIEARTKLMSEVTTKAARIGITASGVETPTIIDKELHEFRSGERITQKEIRQREQLIHELNKRAKNQEFSEAFDDLVEEVAYTWFNRLIAIRFMEVNDYLPDRGIRILSSESGRREPDIVTAIVDSKVFETFTEAERKEALNWKLNGQVEAMNKLYQLIFIKECNLLNGLLPQLFEKIEDYTELLFTATYTNQDGVIHHLVHDIPEADFDVAKGGQVEIIGWLYQYYNDERKNQVINIYKGIVKKNDIPAATQLFTTDWVVRYMVDNSLGKYWLDHNPTSPIKNGLKYLLPSEQTLIVDEIISPEELKIIDNAMGSGHILVYAFDVLLAIYESKGYTEREAVKLILEKNLYGLEIDKRAYQMAYFAILMKARQYDRRILSRGIEPNVKEFIEIGDIPEEYWTKLQGTIDAIDAQVTIADFKVFLEKFTHAKELGSIIRLDEYSIEDIEEYRQVLNSNDVFTSMDELYGLPQIQEQIEHIIEIAKMMIQKYDAVVTNPPYLNKMDQLLKNYVTKNYKDVKTDLFSVFIKNNIQMTKENGYASFMTPFVWMFIKSYEKLRKYISENREISSLIQMEYSAFEEATVPICTFTIGNSGKLEKGTYIRLAEFVGGMEVQKEKVLEALSNVHDTNYLYFTNQQNFKKIPGYPIAYWLRPQIYDAFGDAHVSINFRSAGRTKTHGNDKYVRKFWEVNFVHGIKSDWLEYHNGGEFRRWYGNENEIIDMREDSKKFYLEKGGLPNTNFVKQLGITWNLITSASNSFRIKEPNYYYSSASPTIIFKNKELENENYYYYVLGFLNSKITSYLLKALNPTINTTVGDVLSLPIKELNENIVTLVKENIRLCKEDWDLFEISWDFSSHPLIKLNSSNLLSESFELWMNISKQRFEDLKSNENTINGIFMNLYKLNEELSADVDRKDISVRLADRHRDIKSFISYAVGCMFGRYSLDEEGLIYAGGEWDSSRYQTFTPNTDNVLLISDEEYFEDSSLDIVNRFVDFVRISFGVENLDDNLQFIADTLGGKGNSKEIIRNYFVKNFFKDHVQTYSKRPIYWQFDSGTANGFKALIYMHRYDQDTLGKVRTDYLHQIQKAYESRIELRREQVETSDNDREKLKWRKEIEKLTKQLKETKEYDEKLGHLSLQRTTIDLDDGVMVNYDKIQRDENGKLFPILAKGPATPKK